MQLAFATGLALERIERMVRHVEFHHAATQLLELLALRADLHPGLDRRGARGGIAVAPFDLDEAEAA